MKKKIVNGKFILCIAIPALLILLGSTLGFAYGDPKIAARRTFNGAPDLSYTLQVRQEDTLVLQWGASGLYDPFELSGSLPLFDLPTEKPRLCAADVASYRFPDKRTTVLELTTAVFGDHAQDATLTFSHENGAVEWYEWRFTLRGYQFLMTTRDFKI